MAELMEGTFGYVVSPPFDSASPGDCYFESTDGTQFKVLRHILVDTSPYFADLLKEMPPSTSSELPTFHFDDDAQTIHALLVFLYPVHVPGPLNATLFLKLVEVEEKYRIPETRVAYALSMVIEILLSRETGHVERAIDLFSLSWRFEARTACQFISRHTHSADLTDKTIVTKIVQRSKTIEPYIALTDLRRQRELALDDVIEALEPRKHLCPSHSSSDKMFFTFISMMKTAARNALLAPYPTCLDALSFLGIQGTDGIRTVTWCSLCYAGADRAKLTKQLQEAIARYPQVVSIVPDQDAWRID
ncbi:hypothetical protein FRC04_011592 [Tulasnella sp. 424]|nr:hypothetical protein FRC04_011592 [Tulasnella sp. 424]